MPVALPTGEAHPLFFFPSEPSLSFRPILLVCRSDFFLDAMASKFRGPRTRGEVFAACHPFRFPYLPPPPFK